MAERYQTLKKISIAKRNCYKDNNNKLKYIYSEFLTAERNNKYI